MCIEKGVFDLKKKMYNETKMVDIGRSRGGEVYRF